MIQRAGLVFSQPCPGREARKRALERFSRRVDGSQALRALTISTVPREGLWLVCEGIVRAFARKLWDHARELKAAGSWDKLDPLCPLGTDEIAEAARAYQAVPKIASSGQIERDRKRWETLYLARLCIEEALRPQRGGKYLSAASYIAIGVEEGLAHLPPRERRAIGVKLVREFLDERISAEKIRQRAMDARRRMKPRAGRKPDRVKPLLRLSLRTDREGVV